MELEQLKNVCIYWLMNWKHRFGIEVDSSMWLRIQDKSNGYRHNFVYYQSPDSIQQHQMG